MISYDAVLLILVCYKAYEHFKLMPDKAWSGARLMNVLVRDSVLYFLWYVARHVVNLDAD